MWIKFVGNFLGVCLLLLKLKTVFGVCWVAGTYATGQITMHLLPFQYVQHKNVCWKYFKRFIGVKVIRKKLGLTWSEIASVYDWINRILCITL